MARPWRSMALAGLLACGCSSGSAPAPSTHPTPSATTALQPTASYDAASPVGLAVAAGKVWTVEADDGLTARSGPTAAPDLHVPVGSTPLRAAYDGRLLWVSVFGADRVVGVDPKQGRVVRRVRMPGQPEGITVAFGAIWVVRQAAGRLTQIQPDGTVGRSYHLGNEPRLVAASHRFLFASNFGDDTVTRVDPRTGEVTTSRRLCTGAQDLAAVKAVVWVTCTTDGTLVSLDATTLRILGRVHIPGEPDAVRAVGAHLLVATTEGPAVVEVDANPTHPAVIRRVVLGDAPPLFDQANVDLVVSGGNWWVSSPSENRVLVYTP